MQAAISEAQQAGFNSKEKGVARTALQKMHAESINKDIESKGEMVALYCAIRKIKQGGERIAPNLLREWRSEAFQAVELGDEYFVVPKVNEAYWNNDSTVLECIIPPGEFLELPAGVDTETCFIMNDWAPRSLLGPRVRKMKFKEGYRRSKEMSQANPASGSLCDGPSEDAEVHAPPAAQDVQGTKRKADSEDSHNPAWAAKVRKLLRRASDALPTRSMRSSRQGITSWRIRWRSRQNCGARSSKITRCCDGRRTARSGALR